MLFVKPSPASGSSASGSTLVDDCLLIPSVTLEGTSGPWPASGTAVAWHSSAAGLGAAGLSSRERRKDRNRNRELRQESEARLEARWLTREKARRKVPRPGLKSSRWVLSLLLAR